MSDVINTFTFDPPALDDSDIDDVCIWLLRVMDKGKPYVFVTGLLNYFHKYGALSPKQAEALQKVFDRVEDQFNRNALTSQGILMDEGAPKANVVKLKGRRK